MPKTSRNEYTTEEQERYDAAVERLWKIIVSPALDAEEFRRALDEALAGGFPIDWPDAAGRTLLFRSFHYLKDAANIRAGIPKILVAAGADANIKDIFDTTILDCIELNYVNYGLEEYFDSIDLLLEAGLAPETGRLRYRPGPGLPEFAARHDRLKNYVLAWYGRRARERAGNFDPAPAFDYAL